MYFFQDADAAFMVGAFPRKEGMERKDLLSKNITIFKVTSKENQNSIFTLIKTLIHTRCSCGLHQCRDRKFSISLRKCNCLKQMHMANAVM